MWVIFQVSALVQEIADVEKFFEKAEELFAQDRTELEELGNIPNEFLGRNLLCGVCVCFFFARVYLRVCVCVCVSDPILHTLMEDPVILPTSGVTVDRAVICRHLLSDQSDPFNRLKLTVDMLKPRMSA